MIRIAIASAAVVLTLPTSARAQDIPAVVEDAVENVTKDLSPRAPFRTRIIAGAQLQPAFPGASNVNVRPYFDFSRTRGPRPFTFEAPDESTGISLLEGENFAIGPAIAFEGKRKREKVGGLDEVGWSVELGGFAHYSITPNFRLSLDVRQGVTGHKGLVGMVGADYIMRDGDNWQFSIGPRLTAANGKYSRAYFGVSPREAAATGIPAYDPGKGAISVGATTSAHRMVSRRWGVFGFAKYDRMIGDAAKSPVVQRFGSRDQFSGGLGLSYTFGRLYD